MPKPAREKPVTHGNEAIKSKIREYLTDNLEALLADISELLPKERVAQRMKLMDYVLPKVQAIATVDAPEKTKAAAILDSEGEYDDE
jgi:hypothetical protein